MAAVQPWRHSSVGVGGGVRRCVGAPWSPHCGPAECRGLAGLGFVQPAQLRRLPRAAMRLQSGHRADLLRGVISGRLLLELLLCAGPRGANAHGFGYLRGGYRWPLVLCCAPEQDGFHHSSQYSPYPSSALSQPMAEDSCSPGYGRVVHVTGASGNEYAARLESYSGLLRLHRRVQPRARLQLRVFVARPPRRGRGHRGLPLLREAGGRRHGTRRLRGRGAAGLGFRAAERREPLVAPLYDAWASGNRPPTTSRPKCRRGCVQLVAPSRGRAPFVGAVDDSA